MGTCKIGLQWSINRNVPSSERFKSQRGCGFQTQGLDSADDNERWDSVGFCKNACIHVWGHVKLGCNGVLIETFRLVIGSRAEGCVASKLTHYTRLMTIKGGTVLDSVKMLACMFEGM